MILCFVRVKQRETERKKNLLKFGHLCFISEYKKTRNMCSDEKIGHISRNKFYILRETLLSSFFLRIPFIVTILLSFIDFPPTQWKLLRACVHFLNFLTVMIILRLIFSYTNIIECCCWRTILTDNNNFKASHPWFSDHSLCS